METLGWTHTYKLPGSFQLRSPLRYIERVFHTAYKSNESKKARTVFDFELVDVKSEVSHVPITVRVLLCLTNIWDLSVPLPSESVVIAVNNPKFEVVPSVRRDDSVWVLRVTAQLKG